MKASGKIHQADFDQVILPNCGAIREEVIQGPAFGVDVSVIGLPGNLALAMTSDPLSLIPSLGIQESAWLSVHLMANDMATTGFAPMYAQLVLNLPPSLAQNDFITYWNFVHKYCCKIGVSITGGHTGMIPGQDSSIAGGGTMALTAPKNVLKISSGAQPGDAVIVTKSCALSSAAILAMSFPNVVQNRIGKEAFEQACSAFCQTSSLPDALAAMNGSVYGAEVNAMHDVTEGGVLGAIYEMAVASKNGVRIWNEKLPRGEAQSAVCGLFNLDERFCIGAGSMIIAAPAKTSANVLARLHQQKIPATIVGEFTADKARILTVNDRQKELPYFAKDPYWAAYFEALNRGWK